MRSQNGNRSCVLRAYAGDLATFSHPADLRFADDSKAQRASLHASRLSAATRLFTRSVNWLSGCITQAVSLAAIETTTAQPLSLCAIRKTAGSNSGDF